MSPNPSPEGPIHPLDVVRAQRGWTYRDLAELVAAHAWQLGVRDMAAERQKVWRWAHRGVTPNRIAQVALASALGIPLAQAEATPWPRWLLTTVDIPTPVPVTVDDIAVAARRLAGLRGIDSNSPTLRRALADVLRADRQRIAARPPLAPCGTDGHPAGYARTMPIPVVHVAAGGTRTCHCEHLVTSHGDGVGCLECDCPWGAGDFNTAKVIDDGDGHVSQ
ncbi:hypothetical protein [Frankia sp. AgB32]|uniref:hypothetical protein n=1 Tax=Frankia sp. AgB32 TaxID=631119 RepID=UPI00200D506F|nr:hypothetical protein [Frankia sp. AgB32]MCK9894712.1 hypothetical protein [Frankia sp. AgB32]